MIKITKIENPNIKVLSPEEFFNHEMVHFSIEQTYIGWDVALEVRIPEKTGSFRERQGSLRNSIIYTLKGMVAATKQYGFTLDVPAFHVFLLKLTDDEIIKYFESMQK